MCRAPMGPALLSGSGGGRSESYYPFTPRWPNSGTERPGSSPRRRIPMDRAAPLSGISCTAVTTCTAVGTSFTIHGSVDAGRGDLTFRSRNSSKCRCRISGISAAGQSIHRAIPEGNRAVAIPRILLHLGAQATSIVPSGSAIVTRSNRPDTPDRNGNGPGAGRQSPNGKSRRQPRCSRG